MLKKRQTFYIGEDTEKPMLYEGRIVEARVIAVAPKAVRLEVFGVEVSAGQGHGLGVDGRCRRKIPGR